MDWKDVGKMIGPLAPTLGGILGGILLPGIGGTIGTEAGQILADALGVPNDPASVGGAISADPNAAAAKIQAAEAEAAAKWAALAQIAQAQAAGNSAQAQEINATMRAELAAGQKWWAWRNLYGYSITYEVVVVSNIVFYALLFRPDLIGTVQNAYSFFITWYSLRFGLLGYIHNQSTQEKIAAATGQAPDGLVKSVVKAVRGK